MIKVKMLSISADASGNFPAGTVLEMEPEKAKPLLEGGYAIPVVEKQIEKAVIPSQTVETRTEETNDKPKPKRRRSKAKS